MLSPITPGAPSAAPRAVGGHALPTAPAGRADDDFEPLDGGIDSLFPLHIKSANGRPDRPLGRAAPPLPPPAAERLNGNHVVCRDRRGGEDAASDEPVRPGRRRHHHAGGAAHGTARHSLPPTHAGPSSARTSPASPRCVAREAQARSHRTRGRCGTSTRRRCSRASASTATWPPPSRSSCCCWYARRAPPALECCPPLTPRGAPTNESPGPAAAAPPPRRQAAMSAMVFVVVELTKETTVHQDGRPALALASKQASKLARSPGRPPALAPALALTPPSAPPRACECRPATTASSLRSTPASPTRPSASSGRPGPAERVHARQQLLPLPLLQCAPQRPDAPRGTLPTQGAGGHLRDGHHGERRHPRVHAHPAPRRGRPGEALDPLRHRGPRGRCAELPVGTRARACRTHPAAPLAARRSPPRG
eukprot:scaffold561_cov306-Prasinococcus_capsulatus_cf.AAC.6